MYLLFAGDAYYPRGGWDDYKGQFSTIEAAIEWLAKSEKHFDWAHIVDFQTMSQVWSRG